MNSARTEINDLPNDVLSSIFDLIYERSRISVERCVTVAEDDGEREGKQRRVFLLSFHSKTKAVSQVFGDWPNADLKNPTLFPMSVAAVCQPWRDLLRSTSKYWTRIAIDKDLNGLPVLVFNSAEWSLGSGDVAEEKQCVETLTTALLPHLKRCKRVEYALKHATSLPHFADIVSQSPTNLAAIRLEARWQDGRDVHGITLGLALDSAPLNTLHEISITVPMFMSLRGYSFLKVISEARDLELSFTGHSFRYPTEAFSIDDFFEALHFLRTIHHLKFTDVSFHLVDNESWSKSYRRRGDYRNLSVETLSLERIQAPFTAAFFTYLDSDVTSAIFTMCEPPDWIFNREILIHKLHLVNLPAWTDPAVFLYMWTGVELHVQNCSSFNNNTLHWLAQKNDPGAVNLRTLSLEDCSNIMYSGLSHWIEQRIKAYEAQPNDSGGWKRPPVFCQRLRRFDLVGDVVRLSDWEKGWLRENVGEVNIQYYSDESEDLEESEDSEDSEEWDDFEE
ncbi:unnamed protein product [Cyclocybe aegerita]|uniref:F-box domain-containing protein n=1 Tax=Cyclocybe aegerita TaxID=1973307 RepID=A0A8S0W7Q6_CYCAE|nr:unnamed protein product [Cyclocybe aegerita]